MRIQVLQHSYLFIKFSLKSGSKVPLRTKFFSYTWWQDWTKLFEVYRWKLSRILIWILIPIPGPGCLNAPKKEKWRDVTVCFKVLSGLFGGMETSTRAWKSIIEIVDKIFSRSFKYIPVITVFCCCFTFLLHEFRVACIFLPIIHGTFLPRCIFLHLTLGAGQASDARHSGPRGEDCETSAVLRQKTGRDPSGNPLVLFWQDNGCQGVFNAGNPITTIPVCCLSKEKQLYNVAWYLCA